MQTVASLSVRKTIRRQRSSVTSDSFTTPTTEAAAAATPTSSRPQSSRPRPPLVKQRSFSIEGVQPKVHAPIRKQHSMSEILDAPGRLGQAASGEESMERFCEKPISLETTLSSYHHANHHTVIAIIAALLILGIHTRWTF